MADLLSDASKALGLTNSGEVSKLEIRSWTDINSVGPPDKEFIFKACINPDEFTVNYNVLVTSQTPAGAPGKPEEIISIAPLEITLKFYLDGTGAMGNECKVFEQIQRFYKVVGYHEKNHSPRYLQIYWGIYTLFRPNQFAFDCFLKNASIQYKLFTSDGTPLRAIITATFTEALSNNKIAAEYPKHSADLTHVRIVKEGDTLPALANEIYGDFKYYLEVAKANSLQSFRRLEPNQKLFFPPFDKNVTRKTNG